MQTRYTTYNTITTDIPHIYKIYNTNTNICKSHAHLHKNIQTHIPTIYTHIQNTNKSYAHIQTYYKNTAHIRNIYTDKQNIYRTDTTNIQNPYNIYNTYDKYTIHVHTIQNITHQYKQHTHNMKHTKQNYKTQRAQIKTHTTHYKILKKTIQQYYPHKHTYTNTYKNIKHLVQQYKQLRTDIFVKFNNTIHAYTKIPKHNIQTRYQTQTRIHHTYTTCIPHLQNLFIDIQNKNKTNTTYTNTYINMCTIHKRIQSYTKHIQHIQHIQKQQQKYKHRQHIYKHIAIHVQQIYNI